MVTSLTYDRILAINDTFLATFGYMREDILGTAAGSPAIWSCPAERETLAAIINSEGRAENFTAAITAKTGEIVSCRIFAEYSVFKGKKCVVNLIAAAKELRQSEKRYRDIIKDAQIIIMNIDEAGRILFVNEFGSGYFGYKPSELINRLLKDTLLPEFESTGRNLWRYYQKLFKDSANNQQLICEVVKRDGRRAWVEWINRLQIDKATGSASIVAVGIDITARRRAEALAKTTYEKRRCDKMLEEVIENRISEAAFFSLSEDLGCPLEPPLICCTVALDTADERLKAVRQDPEEWQAWLDTAISLIRSRIGGLSWHADHGLVVLHPPARKGRTKALPDDAAWVEKIETIIKDVFRGVEYVVGVSAAHCEIKTVYRQSGEAVRIGPVFHPQKRIHYWRDLGVNRLLIDQAASAAGLAFIQDYLGPLLENPSSRNEEWLMTLQEIISGDSMNAMAARLHIHPKTLAFRKIRIKRLLQLEIDDPEQRLNLAVALKLKQLRERL